MKGSQSKKSSKRKKRDYKNKTRGAKPNTKIMIKGGNTPTSQINIEHMRDQGNSFFSSLEFEKAIE